MMGETGGELRRLPAELSRLPEVAEHADAETVIREIERILGRNLERFGEKLLRLVEISPHNARFGPAKELLRLECLVLQIDRQVRFDRADTCLVNGWKF